jgi:hypothetical protein
MTENEGEKIKKREKEIISFICNTYCPFCENNTCNAEQIMLKYDSTELTHAQKEITETVQ